MKATLVGYIVSNAKFRVEWKRTDEDTYETTYNGKKYEVIRVDHWELFVDGEVTGQRDQYRHDLMERVTFDIIDGKI
jgi:hypothetical protein